MNHAAAPITSPDYIDYEHYRGAEGYRLLQDCLAGRRDAESVLQALDRACLQDFAGEAGLAAGKWRDVRALPGPRRALVRVGDSGPGDTRDRLLIESDPHRFLEGLLIACWVAGIAEAVVQLDEVHQGCHEVLLQELETLAQEMPITGLTPIRLGRAGASLQPTLALEAETLHWVRELSERGSSGQRWYAVSGRVCEPGIKLASAGSTARELIDAHAGGLPQGQRLYAFVRGGSAAGSILPASQADAALDAGGVMVLSDRDNAVDAARTLLRAFVREARGHDDDVRVAADRIEVLIERPQWTPALLAELSRLLHELPAAGAPVRLAANTVSSLTTHFGPEVQ